MREPEGDALCSSGAFSSFVCVFNLCEIQTGRRRISAAGHTVLASVKGLYSSSGGGTDGLTCFTDGSWREKQKKNKTNKINRIFHKRKQKEEEEDAGMR